jgi:uncharacterized protein involved in response to NO
VRHASLMGSGTLWSIAFAFFFVSHLPILMRPRADGRAG